jgi:hypothetical protein
VAIRPLTARDALVSPPSAHVATFDPKPGYSPAPERSRRTAWTGVTAYARLNLPRSVLRKRAWSFLVLSSRSMAAYKVDAGVLPAGLLQ